MLLAINRHVVNKSRDWETLATRFENVDLTQQELAREIDRGYAFSTQHEGRRKQENFTSAGYIALDFDRASPDEVNVILSDYLVSNYYGLFYYTPSSTPEAPRFRIVFELEHPISDADYYRQAVAAFIWKFGANVDESCKDVCRLFYGSKGSDPDYNGAILPMAVVAQVIKEHKVAQEQERQAREAAEREHKKAATSTNGTSNKGKKAYFEKILDTHCERVRTAVHGTCHDTLLTSATVLGGYLQGEPEVTDEYEIRRRLVDAYSVHPNLNRKEMEDTIKDGLEYGRAKPLPIDLEDNSLFIDFVGFKGATAKKPAIDKDSGEVKDDLFLADFSPDDDGNSDAFIAVYGSDFLFCKAYGWLRWTGTYWEDDLAEQKLFEKITEVFKRRRHAAIDTGKESVNKSSKPSSANINNAVALLEKKLEVLVSTFDDNPNLINCLNGVLNLRTGQLDGHIQEQRFTYCLPVEYSPYARSEEWDNFLKSVVGGGQPVLDYLQQALGYTLTGHTNEEVLFYLSGPSRSGKGTLTEILMTLMGRPLSAEADFNTFTARRDGDSNNFDLAPLKPARVVFASESERYQRLNPAKIKQLTGGNMVYCSFKHKEHFNYRPQYKLWLSSNWPVNGDVDDDALWGRVRVIEFPNSFLGREDKQLKFRLKRPDALRAALAWMVEGAMKWYKAPNGLQTPDAVKEATNKQREEGDFVQSWIDEVCEQDMTAWESNADVYASYSNWCKSNGVEPKQMRNLTASLKAKGYAIGVVNRRGTTTARGITGLRISPRI
jgi:P4 family phage/plasmid primase-like protien